MLTQYLAARYKLSFYRVGDVFSTDHDGNPLTEAELDKWFASADTKSEFAHAVLAVPLGDDLEHVQSLAIEHLGLALEGPCSDCKAMQPAEVLGSDGLCSECAKRLRRETLADMYETATKGWHD